MSDIVGNFNTRSRVSAGWHIESEIDFDGDQDWFQTQLVPGIEYEILFRSRGKTNPLEDPAFKVFTADRRLIHDVDDDGPNKHARLRLTVDHFDTLFIAARAKPNQTGDYRISIRALSDDYAAGPEGGGRMTMIGGVGMVNGIHETRFDQDWFRVELKPHTWYQLSGDSPGFMRNSILRQTSHLHSNQKFYSGGGGLHYVVTRNHFGFYSTTLTEHEQPFLTVSTGQTSDSITISRMIRMNQYPFSSFHLYSDQALGFGYPRYQYKVKSAHQVHRASLESFRRWSSLGTSTTESNVYVRGFSNENNQSSLSSWVKINVASNYAGSLFSGKRWRPVGSPKREIQFAFATALPDYFLGDARFPTFDSLTSAEMDAVRSAIRKWDATETTLSFAEVAPNANNNNATIMIFKSTISQPVLGFFPAQQGGSDLVLDQNSPLLSNLQEGSEGYFELLRGVGNILGLKSTADLSRNQSVLGRRFDEETFNAVYPTSPGAFDISALTEHYDRYIYRKDRSVAIGDSTYRFVDGKANTYSDFGGSDWIDASDLQPTTERTRTKIDLTPSATSYKMVGPHKTAQISLSFDTQIENARGSFGNDQIRGNGWDNILIGSGGNDVLEGRVGNDTLNGGTGGDTYVYGFADGHDVINEANSGGRDRLIVKGMFSFNDLANDMTFYTEKNGTDLVIQLSLDGDNQSNQGSIRIRNMNQRRSQVEILSLSNQNRDFGDISLRNLYRQATNEPQRFTYTPDSDLFGRLVVPV